jgi:Crinkler effector protein N-terminal domain
MGGAGPVNFCLPVTFNTQQSFLQTKAVSVVRFCCHNTAQFANLLIVLQVEKMASMLTINCLVYGDTVERAFAVDIGDGKLVSHLKDEIKKKKEDDFRNTDANKLTLWKVDIPDDDSVALTIIPNDNAIMLPTKKLVKYFTKEPTDEHIHVIVNSPSQTFSTHHNSVATIVDRLGTLSLQSREPVCEFFVFFFGGDIWQLCK